MADSPDESGEVGRRLRQEVLLTEYRVCEEQATATANSIWTSSSIFLAAWIAGLAVMVANLNEVDRIVVIWLLAVAAVLSQSLWWVFIARSLQKGQYLFVRQRQIEIELGMLKGLAINAIDHADRRQEIRDSLQSDGQKAALDGFLDEAKLVSTPFEKCLLSCFKVLFGWLGLGGRASLYLLSVLVAVAWVLFAAFVTLC